MNITYAYSGTQNNGKITSQTDNISGEQVVYAYDALNRLASAAATSNSWGQSYSYDGFGNLTDQTVTAGSAPAYHVVYNASNNRQTTDCADSNGNLGSSSACSGAATVYDVENRMISPSSANQWQYSYAPRNKRVWRGVWTGSTLTTDEVTFWSGSKKLGAWALSWNGNQLIATMTESNTYFGGKLIKNATGYVSADRLGSIGKFYPYGQEKPSATTNGTEKYTGYLRDSETGLDYAINRYESPGTGRFLTPDPSRGSVSVRDPGSWNRYAYVGGDPVNRIDPSGMEECPPGTTLCIMPSGGGGPSVSDPTIIAGGDFCQITVVCNVGAGPNIEAIEQQAATVAAQDIAAQYEAQQEAASALCNNPQAVGFIKANLADATTLATNLNVPVQLVLAVSANESSFGTSNIALAANNFFGLWAGAPGQTGTYTTPNGAVVAAFSGPDGFLASGNSFVQLVQGSASGITDASTFFQTLHDVYGFGAGESTPQYIADMLPVANATLGRIQNCTN